MKKDRKPTYISLFSSAGVGCYGFKMEEFQCIATNELIPRRLDIQKCNQKCKYASGYICGDITQEAIQNRLYSEIAFWEEKEELTRVDVVIATPPCQGMSVANHKKTNQEIVRNSLVVESIKIIKKIHPRFFVFENVPAFMKTLCTDVDGTNKPISEAIEENLGREYSYISKVINFKSYGACSSRQRTLVIGVSNDYADAVSPYELYPDLVPERTVRQVIGDLKPLPGFGEIDEQDLYHSFRPYPEHMRDWIADLEEGQSAFDNEEDCKKPHQVINGKIVINQQKNGDKYRRQYWDRVGPCIHTRNDQLASQNTIHPQDDRVFSIREIMRMMTVPSDFRWTATSPEVLNRLPAEEKRAYLRKEEIKIRQSLGEAVPTVIFQSIAQKIKEALKYPPLNTAQINKLVNKYRLTQLDNLIAFIEENPKKLSLSALGKVAELANTQRTDKAAYFTGKSLITQILKALPGTEKETVRILEPSVGVGNFVPLIARKFEGKQVILDVVDIDPNSIRLTKIILEKYRLPANITVNYRVADFLLHNFQEKYDYIIGNPPFYKMKSQDPLLEVYRNNAINRSTTNICSFFLDKAVELGSYVVLVFPKFILNTPEFAPTRAYLEKKNIACIIDFGEKGFPGVLVETLAIFINNAGTPGETRVISVTHGIDMVQSQAYIFSDQFPYWIIYRDEEFDAVRKKLKLDVFTVFRDRQITNKDLSETGDIRVLKSRNISDDGKDILNIPDYDSYASLDRVKNLSAFSFYDRDDVYLTPNMTYKPRVMKKPRGLITNGSLAVLLPKEGVHPTQEQLDYFSSEEYRRFYQIARNYQTRSLNVDACSVFFYGLLRGEPGRQKRGGSMMTQQDIAAFCDGFDYDIRKSRNGRWIDQKCTPDVMWSIADFVLNYVDTVKPQFTVKEIWQSDYAKLTVAETYSKPGTDEAKAENEYDKVFSQPLCLLCYAGVIRDVRPGKRHLYEIADRDVLEYIARNDVNALRFLQAYIEKVLRDSGLYPLFADFFDKQDKIRFNALKTGFIDFYHRYTKIQKEYEPKRIFTKVLNPLAFKYGKKGTEDGRMSPDIIKRSDMMYNQDNFRDVYGGKPKGVTRQEWLEQHPEIDQRGGYFKQMLSRSRRIMQSFMAEYRGNQSEWTQYDQDQTDMAPATQYHHIFPKNEFLEIMHCCENLIALTPNQHYGSAHPNNNPQIVDVRVQKQLLLAKVRSIRANLENGEEEQIYSFRNLKRVLYVGWDDDRVLDIADGDFAAVEQAIHAHYGS